jgi:hypothetical protein
MSRFSELSLKNPKYGGDTFGDAVPRVLCSLVQRDAVSESSISYYN